MGCGSGNAAFEDLVGDLAGAYSRRINIRHRLVYQMIEAERVVKVRCCACGHRAVAYKLARHFNCISLAA